MLGRAAQPAAVEASPPELGAAAGGRPAGDFLHNVREVLKEPAAEAKKNHFGKETDTLLCGSPESACGWRTRRRRGPFFL